MQRLSNFPRHNYLQKLADHGMVYTVNADGSAYWQESVYYQFTKSEIETLYEAARELHQMFLHAVEHVIENKRYRELGLPPTLDKIIETTWNEEHWELYGRFDLAFNQGQPKLLEYNADTPTGLLEASISQYFWKEELFPHLDQFNSLHEALVARWKVLDNQRKLYKKIPLYFTSVAGHLEDRMTAGYLAQTAEEAGFRTEYLSIDRIGYKNENFVDAQKHPIEQIFKLYPWEWMAIEAYGPYLKDNLWNVIEPAWKAVIASKGLLLILQELYPRHPLLLEVSPKADFSVRKPYFGREGNNVTILGKDQRPGVHTNELFLYQEYCSLEEFPGTHTQCGVWMIGPEPAGLGMREDTRAILGNGSHFVPHLFG